MSPKEWRRAIFECMRATRYSFLCLSNPTRVIGNRSAEASPSLRAIRASNATTEIFPAILRAFLVALFPLLTVVALKASDDAPLRSGNENDVVTAIKIAQKNNVRESYGEEANECFTDVDYQEFEARNVALKIARSLRSDRKFMEGVLALRQKPAPERKAFIQSCRRALRPTWAEQGYIGPDGQTDAGKAAELDIANAVASMVEELAKLPEEKIDEIFRTR
jgi:hypothetical protein